MIGRGSYGIVGAITKRLGKIPPPSVKPPNMEASVKSDKRDQIVQLLKSVQLELKAKRLLERYYNWPSGTLANRMIRVDNIPASVVDCWSFALLPLVHVDYYFEEGSNGYAFLTFGDHRNANRFVERFNNVQIPETDMVYQLSWAPFDANPLDDMFDEEDEDEDEDAEEVNGNQMKFSSSEDKEELFSADLCSKIRAFHGHFLVEPRASEPQLLLGRVEMKHDFDEGCTTVLCLTMVDPGIERGFLEDIFEKYGKCTVHLPGKTGYGFVKFEERECAEAALAEIATLLRDEHVCRIKWCTELKLALRLLKAKEQTKRGRIGLEQRIKRIEEEESLRLRGEWDGEEDATVTTKTIKHSTSALNCTSKAKEGQEKFQKQMLHLLKAQEQTQRSLIGIEQRIKRIEEERDREEDAAVTTKTIKHSTSALNCTSKAKEGQEK